MTREEVPYDDRLITCPECHSTFEAEDATVLDLATHNAEVLRATADLIEPWMFPLDAQRFLRAEADRIEAQS